MIRATIGLLLLFAFAVPQESQTVSERPRPRDIGIVIGILPPGPLNAITDVAGVRVGQVTVIEGERIRTGVTAIIPHPGNVFKERVPAAIHVGNGFGKLLGASQVSELGELETPIILTCTLCVWKAADAMADWLLAQPGMADVRSINPVVGETNDGFLNDIRARPIRSEHVVQALEKAAAGAVAEGSVGAGTGTVAFGWKGGIGTSSRRLPGGLGGYTVGALVQTNFGGVLTVNGAPVGREVGRYVFQRELDETVPPAPAPKEGPPQTPSARLPPESELTDRADGSVMIVIATDAPLSARNLERLAARALVGLSRTGASMSNGSGDYVIAFSTAAETRRPFGSASNAVGDLSNDSMSPLFQAVAEATEEAIYNSLFRATTVRGHNGTIEALPLDRTLEILRRYNALHWNKSLPPRRK